METSMTPIPSTPEVDCLSAVSFAARGARFSVPRGHSRRHAWETSRTSTRVSTLHAKACATAGPKLVLSCGGCSHPSPATREVLR